MGMSRCKACAADIFWARTASNKLIPIDSEPVDGGNITIVSRRHDGTPSTVRVGIQPDLLNQDTDTLRVALLDVS